MTTNVKDAGDVLILHGSGEKSKRFIAAAIADEKPMSEASVIDGLRGLSMSEVFEEWQMAKGLPVVATGVVSLDGAIGNGIAAGQVTMVLGYTGSGKSEFVRQIIQRAARAGSPAIHVDVELGTRRIAERTLSQATRIPSSDLRRRNFSSNEQVSVERAIGELSTLPIVTICPKGVAPLGVIERAVIEALERLGPHSQPPIIVLDSAQRLAAGAAGKEIRLQNQAFMWWASGLAQQTGAAVLVTSEQSRKADGRPTPEQALTSGAETRAIEFVSDTVLALIPNEDAADSEATGPNKPADRRVSILVCKAREGRVGYVPDDLVFEYPCWGMRVDRRFDERAERILEVFADGAMHSGNAIHKKLGGNRQSVLAKLRALAAEGVLEFGEDPKSGESGYRLVVPKAGTRGGSSDHRNRNDFSGTTEA